MKPHDAAIAEVFSLPLLISVKMCIRLELIKYTYLPDTPVSGIEKTYNNNMNYDCGMECGRGQAATPGWSVSWTAWTDKADAALAHGCVQRRSNRENGLGDQGLSFLKKT